MPRFGKMELRDLIEKAKNAFDAEDEQMYLDAAQSEGVKNPDEEDLDAEDFN